MTLPFAEARTLADDARARGLVSFDEQNEKLRLVEMVARYYWGNEI